MERGIQKCREKRAREMKHWRSCTYDDVSRTLDYRTYTKVGDWLWPTKHLFLRVGRSRFVDVHDPADRAFRAVAASSRVWGGHVIIDLSSAWFEVPIRLQR